MISLLNNNAGEMLSISLAYGNMRDVEEKAHNRANAEILLFKDISS